MTIKYVYTQPYPHTTHRWNCPTRTIYTVYLGYYTNHTFEEEIESLNKHGNLRVIVQRDPRQCDGCDICITNKLPHSREVNGARIRQQIDKLMCDNVFVFIDYRVKNVPTEDWHHCDIIHNTFVPKSEKKN